MTGILGFAPALAVIGGCASPEPFATAADPFVDVDPDPRVFEAVLTARQATIDVGGELVSMLSYGGAVPGPEIRVTQGDRVVVHLQNALPSDFPTSIHWHGVEGTNAADGTATTQLAVQPGGAFTYDFVVPRAGIFWYHPHVRGAQSTFSGLYAPLVVDDPDDAALVAAGVLPTTRRTLVLSDVSSFRGEVLSVEVDDPTEIMNGTEGDALLVDGQVDPVIDVPAGEGIRLQLVNASITRFWRLSVPGHLLVRVGGQNGLLERAQVEGGVVAGVRTDAAGALPVDVDLGFDEGEILLAPGERADVVLVLDEPVGAEVALRWEDYARGRHEMWVEDGEMVMGDAEDDGTRPGQDVATFRVIAGQGAPYAITGGDPVLAAVGRSVDAASLDGVTVDFTGPSRIELQEEMDMEQGASGEWVMSSRFFIDGATWMAMDHGPDQPDAPNARYARFGDTIAWEVHNATPMAHPYHLHGFSFQVLEFVRDDAAESGDDPATTRWAPRSPEWVDTVNVPAFTSAILRVDITDPNGDGGAAGRWMAHCHIFQHGEAGMMAELIVAP